VAGYLIAVVAAAGCDHDGRVLVVVDTDFTVPDELGLVRATVRGSNGLEQSRDFIVDYRLAPPHSDPAAMPLSFVIVPREAGAGDFEVSVSGFDRNAPEALVTRRAITGFRPGKTLVLPLPLLRSCGRVMCPLDQTCRDGACVDPHVPVGELVEVDDPGEELGDAGPVAPVRDAGGDAAGDGGTPGSCTFGPPALAIDRATDWDPTVTSDDGLLVWNEEGAGLQYATRPRPDADFLFRGPVTIEGLLEPVAPAIGADGTWIVLQAKLTPASASRVYELRRDGAAMRFIDPVDVIPDVPEPLVIAEPGTNADGSRVIAFVDETSVIEGTRASRGTAVTGPAPLRELDPYAPRYPSLSGDGLTLAFAAAGRDIYLVRRPDLASDFGTPEPVEIINTLAVENDPWLNHDATKMYFVREEADSDYDILVTICR
jgi:hypothetical protein